MASVSENLLPPRWLAWWARLTVAAVCPLLLLGALVTTMQVGMADQRSVVSPWQAIMEMLRGERGLGWIVEHSHRLAGWFAGLCGIGLALGFWINDKRRGFRWLGLVGLAMIGVQGLLGIFRVALNDWWGTGLAWVHGSFAQLVFAVLVGLAVVTSPSWHNQDWPIGSRLRRWSLLCVGLVFAQLVLGGVVRHQQNAVMFRLHMVWAFIVLAGLMWLVQLALKEKVARWLVWGLLGLLTFQLLLGVESSLIWMRKYHNPAMAIHESVGLLAVRTTHYFLGSMLLATSVAIALKANRSAFFGREALPSAGGIPGNAVSTWDAASARLRLAPKWTGGAV